MIYNTPVMELELAEMVELYEYKVADLVAGREPRGGRASLKRLRGQLIPLLAGSRMMRKFMQIDQQYRALEMQPTPRDSAFSEHGAGLQLGNLGLQKPQLAPQLSTEQQVLQQLALDLYWLQLERSLPDQLAPLLSGNREGARLAYATLQNLQVIEGGSPLVNEANLTRYQPGCLIPGMADPLVQMEAATLPGLVVELVREVHHILQALMLQPRQVRTNLEHFLLRVVQATEARARERWVQQARQAQSGGVPEAQRRQAQDEERRLAMLAAEDRQNFMVATQQLLDLVCRILPIPAGTAPVSTLDQGILAALEPEHRLEALGPEQTSVTLRVVPMRLSMAGYDLTLVGSRGAFSLVVGQVEYPIDEAQPRIVMLGGHELWMLPREGYLHLHLEPRLGDALAQRLAEGRLLAYLLWPGQYYGYLRLMRALSARLKGTADLAAFSPTSAERYPQAPPDVLEEFVRKGLESLKLRIQQIPGWRTLLDEVAQGLGMGGGAQKLEQLLQEWFSPPPLDPQLVAHSLGAQPLLLEEGGLAFSLSMEEGTVSVRVSGHDPRRLADLLVWSAPQGMVLFVCDGHTIVCQRVLGTGA